MEIDITSPEGNIFTAMGIATKLMRKAGRNEDDIKRMQRSVMDAGSYTAACEAITDATFGAITFTDSSDEDE